MRDSREADEPRGVEILKMKLCINNHAMTRANTGHATEHRKSGAAVQVAFCRQCRRDSARRYAATHKRPSRAEKRKQEWRIKPKVVPTPRIPCGSCKAVTRSPEMLREHRRRFHEALWP